MGETKEAGMSFTDLDKLKAAAIVNIFETGRPFGNYSSIAVLDDGAGISYGISQFTHRSGALYAVVARYLFLGGTIGRAILRSRLGLLGSADVRSISAASSDVELKNALKAAGSTPEMRAAQWAVAAQRFMMPALNACSGSGFIFPLSLAVIYDSIIHGSWEKIRDRVRMPDAGRHSSTFEKVWITAYVGERHRWLRSIPRLRTTSYRTAFFLAQAAAGNWQLALPLNVHGRLLRSADISEFAISSHFSTARHTPKNPGSSFSPPFTSDTGGMDASPADTAGPSRPNSRISRTWEKLKEAFSRYDRVETVLHSMVRRTDSARSLWTTILGTAWQAFWAVAAFLIGLPREAWLVAAIAAGVLTTIYLYRQFVLGRIRELYGHSFLPPSSERRQDPAIEI